MNPHTSKPFTSLPRVPRSELKVLLVDNDSFQLELISEVLLGLGIRSIVQADGGEKALKLISGSATPFDLLVLDLHMPGMDGFQFMEALAQKSFFGGLIIASGQNSEVLKAASLVAKIQRFTLLGAVPKPVGRAAMQEQIAKLSL